MAEDLPRSREAAAAERENGAHNRLSARRVVVGVATAAAAERAVEEIRPKTGQAVGVTQREAEGAAELGLGRGAAGAAGGKASFHLARLATT